MKLGVFDYIKITFVSNILGHKLYHELQLKLKHLLRDKRVFKNILSIYNTFIH